jgi:hypothetical protein
MQANNEIKNNDMFTESEFGNGVFVNCQCGSKRLFNREKTKNKHLQTKKHKLYIQSLNPQTMDQDGKKKMVSHHRNSIKKHQKEIRYLKKEIKAKMDLLEHYDSDDDTEDELVMENYQGFIDFAEAHILKYTEEIAYHTNHLNNIISFY